MKKLMIGLCAVAFAAVAQAATVNWTGSTSGSTGVTSGYVAYLVDSSAYDSLGAAVTAIMSSGSTAAGVMYNAAATYNATQGKAVVAQNGKTLPSSYVADQEVNYWSILFDGSVGTDGTAKNYYNLCATSDNADAAKYTKISSGSLMTAQNMNATAGAWTAVPEPTSGLLLLLGMAGLALRRRRA